MDGGLNCSLLKILINCFYKKTMLGSSLGTTPLYTKKNWSIR